MSVNANTESQTACTITTAMAHSLTVITVPQHSVNTHMDQIQQKLGSALEQ